MRPNDALRVEGGDDYLVLCYGVFDGDDLDVAFEALGLLKEEQDVFKFWDEDWINGIILLETRVRSEADVMSAICSASNSMLGIQSCRASLCMFEGVFPDFGRAFEANLAECIYAFSFEKNDIVVALSETFIASPAWKSLIELARERLSVS